MKRIFPSLIAILCTLPMSVKAQMPRITSYDGGLNAFRKIRKEVYDTAKIAVYYDLKYLKDSTKTDKYTEAKTLLQISDKYTKYGDYYQLALDSMDIYMGKSKKNARDRQAIKTWNEAIGRINYYTVSITDLADYQTKVQFYGRTRQTLWRAVQMLTQKLCCQTIHDCPKVVPLHYESE